MPASRPDSTIAGIVWQPNSSQWRVIWALALLIILFWPGPQDHSLAILSFNWIADPKNTLPQLPNDFSLQDGDDPEAVTAHDMQEADFNRAYASSRFMRLRIRMRDMQEPFDPGTQRQLLVAIAILGGLLVWRLGGRPARG